MKKLLLFSLLFATYTLAAQSYNGPESVTYDAASKRYFISNNGNNQILARDSAGALSVFTTNISSGPHGLEIVGNTLYACDGASMKGFDLSNGTQVMNLNVGATFLNGICSDGSTYLYATDFSAKNIYKINIATQSYTQFVSGLAKSPNGIIYDANQQRIVWVSWGTNAPIMQATLADSVVSQVVATTLSNCDGIVRDGSGNYYVSAWGTQAVHQFDSSFSNTPVAVITGLSSPADIYYNLANDSLVSPNSGNNTVTFHFLGTAPTALEKVETAQCFIYPNPVATQLYIESNAPQIEELTLFDVLGQRLMNQQNVAAPYTLELAQYPQGVYLLSVRIGKDIITKKIVLER